MKRSEIIASVVLIPLDWVLVTFGFLAAYPIGRASETSSRILSLTSQTSFEEYFSNVWWIGLILVPILAMGGLYQLRSSHSWHNRIFRIVVGISVGITGIELVSLLRDQTAIPRATLLYAWIFCIAFVVLGRILVYLAQLLLHRLGHGVVSVGIVGNQDVQGMITRDFAIAQLPFHEVRALLSPEPITNLFLQLDSEKPLDELIVVTDFYTPLEISAIQDYCLEHQMSFTYVPAILAEVPESYKVRKELGVVAVEFHPTPLEGWGRVVKRVFDIFAVSFLILLATPIYIIIAIWMYFADRGPLIYKNQRLGKGMVPIEIWKFRSMRVEFCDGPGYSGAERFAQYLADNPDAKKEYDETIKLKDDPRVSSIGRVLRKTSLDELPQFFNVLQGSLSLVGPRPKLQNSNIDEVALYGEAAKMLFTIKPGVTGLWQVSGRNDVSYKERIQLDMRYIQNWTIWWDILICFKTISVFLPKKGKGAY